MFFSASEVRQRFPRGNVVTRKSFSRDPEDPSAAIMKEPWEEKQKRIRSSSPYGHLPNWSILPMLLYIKAVKNIYVYICMYPRLIILTGTNFYLF